MRTRNHPLLLIWFEELNIKLIALNSWVRKHPSSLVLTGFGSRFICLDLSLIWTRNLIMNQKVCSSRDCGSLWVGTFEEDKSIIQLLSFNVVGLHPLKFMVVCLNNFVEFRVHKLHNVAVARHRIDDVEVEILNCKQRLQREYDAFPNLSTRHHNNGWIPVSKNVDQEWAIFEIKSFSFFWNNTLSDDPLKNWVVLLN